MAIKPHLVNLISAVLGNPALLPPPVQEVHAGCQGGRSVHGHKRHDMTRILASFSYLSQD